MSGTPITDGAEVARMRDIPRQLLELRLALLRKILVGQHVVDVRIVETYMSERIRAVCLYLRDGTTLEMRATHIEDLMLVQSVPDPDIVRLEREWNTLNKKHHLGAPYYDTSTAARK